MQRKLKVLCEEEKATKYFRRFSKINTTIVRFRVPKSESKRVFRRFSYGRFVCFAANTVFYFYSVLNRIRGNTRRKERVRKEKNEKHIYLTLLQLLMLHLENSDWCPAMTCSFPKCWRIIIHYFTWLRVSAEAFGRTECGKRRQGFLPGWQWWRSSRQALWCESGGWIGLSNVGRRWDD